MANIKIEFDTDINDYHEARKFKLLIDSMLAQKIIDSSLKSFASDIRIQLEEFVNKPEFANFEKDDHGAHHTASYDESSGESFARLIRNLVGPSRQELESSKQLQKLIARAERAEISAFDALSESTEISLELDELSAKVKQLEEELIRIQKKP